MIIDCTHGLEPVSYTHLDVYKRQTIQRDIIRKLIVCQEIRKMQHLAVMQCAVCWTKAAWYHTDVVGLTVAVSYTHLLILARLSICSSHLTEVRSLWRYS